MNRLFAFAMVAFCLWSTSALAGVPTSITVQGRLTDSTGIPLPAGAKTFTFRIVDDSVGGTEVWPGGGGEVQSITSDASGLWIGLLGAINPLTDAVFSDNLLWLEIDVNGTTLPTTQLLTSPYTFRVSTVDGASGGNITSKVTIGPGHTNTGVSSFVAGQDNSATGNWSSIPGGTDNVVSDTGAIVSGGGNNSASGKYSTVGGGGGSTAIQGNSATGRQSAVGGGNGNLASGSESVVGGGVQSIASGSYATVSGGNQNTASGPGAAVGGGNDNQATGSYSTIGGGIHNLATGDRATIAGGGGLSSQDSNMASGDRSFIGGGSKHIASGTGSTICGGQHNRARGELATIGGGGGSFATPADSNSAAGHWGTVPGGRSNRADGNYSFAAGRRAKADHGGTFVWADSTNANFASSAPNQFLIRASGGVGIGTNDPDRPLHVQDGSAGTVTGNSSAAAVFERNGDTWLHILSPDDNMRGILFGSPANALMGSIRFNPSGGGEEKGYEIRGRNNNILVEIDSLGNLHARGSITAVGTCCASDERLKRNIRSLPGGLDKVTRLRGVSYEWKPDETGERIFPSGEQIGLIAQEVQKVVPEAVNEDEDGYLAVDYARLVPLLIEGMKEQQRIIESQNERITTLERSLEQ